MLDFDEVLHEFSSLLAEYNALKDYLAGDCGCCEYSHTCKYLQDLTFPEKGKCEWKFSSKLIEKYMNGRK